MVAGQAFFGQSGYKKQEVRMVKINGEEFDVAGKTITEYLETTSYDVRRIAIERNGEIVPKAMYESTILMAGDSVEVVSFVGGG